MRGQVACTEEDITEQTLSVENHTKRDRSEGQGMYRRIILKQNFKKQDGRIWTGLIWFRIETSSGLVSAVL
jgi:hypothetical protein